MNVASWGPLGGALGDLLGRLGAILGVLERSCGISDPSCTIVGASWGPLGPSWGSLEGLEAAPRRKTISDGDLPGTSREPPGSLPGYFSSGDPQGPPRAREEENCKAVAGDLSTPLARWAGEFY